LVRALLDGLRALGDWVLALVVPRFTHPTGARFTHTMPRFTHAVPRCSHRTFFIADS